MEHFVILVSPNVSPFIRRHNAVFDYRTRTHISFMKFKQNSRSSKHPPPQDIMYSQLWNPPKMVPQRLREQMPVLRPTPRVSRKTQRLLSPMENNTHGLHGATCPEPQGVTPQREVLVAMEPGKNAKLIISP